MNRSRRPSDEEPSSILAERFILYKLLRAEESAAGLREYGLGRHQFLKRLHQQIYDTVVNLEERGEAVDLINITEELQRHSEGCSEHDYTYVLEIYDRVDVPFTSTEVAAKQLVELYRKRRLRSALRSAHTDAGTGDIELVLAKVMADIRAISDETGCTGIEPLGDTLGRVLADAGARVDRRKNGLQIEGLVGTGLTDLDRILGGFHPGHMVVVASRPSVGKTALAGNFACAAVRQVPTVFFSLEQSSEEIALRILCAESRVPMGQVRSGWVTDDQMQKLVQTAGELASLPLYLDDTASLDIDELTGRIRFAVDHYGAKVIFIDYLQLVTAKRAGRYSREQQVAEVSKRVKAAAKTNEVTMVALAQLGRMGKGEKSRRPTLVDLRESGQIEQDADSVLLLHREDYQAHGRDDPSPGAQSVTELIVAKQRDGNVGVVHTVFHREKCLFTSMSNEPAPEAHNEPF